MTEKVLNATRSLITAVVREVSILMKTDLNVVASLAEKVQKTQCESAATSRPVSRKEGKIGEPELICRL